MAMTGVTVRADLSTPPGTLVSGLAGVTGLTPGAGAATRPRWFIRSCLTLILGPWSLLEDTGVLVTDLGTLGILSMVPLVSGDLMWSGDLRTGLGLPAGRLARTASPGT